MDHGPHHPSHPSSPPRAAGLPLLSGAGGTATDPGCGMTVDPARAAASVTHDGHTYYFCAAACARKFQADPRRYLGGPPAAEPREAPAPPGARVEYVCPMDPEVRSDHPGACPKCGMALE